LKILLDTIIFNLLDFIFDIWSLPEFAHSMNMPRGSER
jgi:hypothetical protein